MIPLGEQTAGSLNGRARLSEEDVIDILERYSNGEKQAALAAAYGVSQPRISQIVSGRAWKNVERD